MKNETVITEPQGMVSLNKWRCGVGISTATVWRYRQKGWLKTLNICGRQYLTASAIADFERRAANGEFAQEHKTPVRKKAKRK